MRDAGDRLIERVAKSNAAKYAAALAQHFRGRTVRLQGRTSSVLKALGRFGSGPGTAEFARGIAGSVLPGDRIISSGLAMPTERVAVALARQSPVDRLGLPKTPKVLAGMRPAVLLAGRDRGKAAIDARVASFAKASLPAVAQTRRPALTQRMAGNPAAIGGGAGSRAAAAIGPRLARAAAGTTPIRAASVLPPAPAAQQRAIAGQPAAQAVAPGFHRTVRQASQTGRAGDVYLDRNLVGYHLAAAITAEQTRAAGRPNISGSSFNSSMAALRPSGAGL